ncbi:MAG: SGNH/GDSL hydrolase family protein [Gemmatimonadales bacterium]
MPTYSRYVALGDSMSLDDYPTGDVLNLRAILPRQRLPIGAASLLYQNHPRWPEFEGRDLLHRHLGVTYKNLSKEGATVAQVSQEQLPQIGEMFSGAGLLLTLTVGGSDLLNALTAGAQNAEVAGTTGGIMAAYSRLVATLRRDWPGATIMLTTLYDITEGSGNLPRTSDFFGRLPVSLLERLNDHIRRAAAETPGVLLADLHRNLKGRGADPAEIQQWYWRHSLVEPNARGASDIRRVWLEALGM